MSAEFAENSRPATLRSLRALLLSLILAALGVVVLLSILNTVAVVSSPWGSNLSADLGSATSVSTGPCDMPSVHITKTVDPAHVGTGGIVSICFIIKRPELDVALAQDVSGSMDEEDAPVQAGGWQTRLEASQAAACAFVDELQDTDRVAVVPYSSNAYVIQHLTTTRSQIKEAISGLVADGYTNIGDGIKVGYQELISPAHVVSETIKAVVLLSDGKANCFGDVADCPRDEDEAANYALGQAGDAAAHDIRIYTIGFGDEQDVNVELLETIAITTGGEYYFAPNSDVLETVYLTIALELHNLVITDVLTRGVEADGGATVSIPICDSSLISNPTTVCSTATVNLDPNYEGLINGPGSGFCYQNLCGQIDCEGFINPWIAVDGRKITGYVFYDVNANGLRDEDERGAPNIVLRAGTDLTTETDISGSYTLRIASGAVLSVVVDVPPGYVATTPVSRHIPSATGIYTADFGIRQVMYLPLIFKCYPLPSLINGSFENDWSGWIHGGELSQTITSERPHSGEFSALLGEPDDKCEIAPKGSAWIEQRFLVCSTDSPTLSFHYNIWTYDRNTELKDAFDSFDVRINDRLEFRDAKITGTYGCQRPVKPDLGWRTGEIDLGGYHNQQITIHFEVRNTDEWFNTWVYVDDVEIKR